MWCNRFRIIVCTAAACLLMACSAMADSPGPAVRIGLSEGQSSASVKGSQGLVVLKNGAQWKSYSANVPVKVVFQNGYLYVDGKRSDGNVQFRPAGSNALVYVDNNAYRGHISIIKSPRRWGMTIINEVPMEYYLYGVVGKEASPSWTVEALKAQAVAARTYAIMHKGYFGKNGFDMTDDTSSQTYGGVMAEYPSVRQAVDATRGEILTYNGKPIDALFSTTGGGYTENSENVWGDFRPYLRGVYDESDKMPGYRWQATTTPADLSYKLSAAGKGVGTVQSIILSPLQKRPITAADRGISGRVKSMVIQGNRGRVVVTGNAFQQIFGLKSTLFDIYQEGPLPQDIDLYKPKRGNTLSISSGKPLYIVGYGWGHGLGMSQWGAQQMAQEDRGKTRDFYRKILSHYYSNTKLEKLY